MADAVSGWSYYWAGVFSADFCTYAYPVIMSYIRAVDGYALGAFLGIIAVIAVSILLPYVQKWQRRFLEHE